MFRSGFPLMNSCSFGSIILSIRACCRHRGGAGRVGHVRLSIALTTTKTDGPLNMKLQVAKVGGSSVQRVGAKNSSSHFRRSFGDSCGGFECGGIACVRSSSPDIMVPVTNRMRGMFKIRPNRVMGANVKMATGRCACRIVVRLASRAQARPLFSGSGLSFFVYCRCGDVRRHVRIRLCRF